MSMRGVSIDKLTSTKVSVELEVTMNSKKEIRWKQNKNKKITRIYMPKELQKQSMIKRMSFNKKNWMILITSGKGMIMKKNLLKDKSCRLDSWIINSLECNRTNNPTSRKWTILKTLTKIKPELKLPTQAKCRNLKKTNADRTSNITKTCWINNSRWKTNSKCMVIWAVLKKL
jgi:hypothetical protein